MNICIHYTIYILNVWKGGRVRGRVLTYLIQDNNMFSKRFGLRNQTCSNRFFWDVKIHWLNSFNYCSTFVSRGVPSPGASKERYLCLPHLIMPLKKFKIVGFYHSGAILLLMISFSPPPPLMFVSLYYIYFK